jgi:WD40 repeat protein
MVEVLCAGELVRTRSGHTNGIQELAVSPSGSLVLTGSDDHTCKVFDIVA